MPIVELVETRLSETNNSLLGFLQIIQCLKGQIFVTIVDTVGALGDED